MNDDLRELLASLKSHGVEFLVIGAHALGVHGRARMTEDLDLWAGRSRENAERLRAALSDWGIQIGEQGTIAFADQDRQMIRIGVPPNMVDILNFAGSVPFEEAYRRRIEAIVDGEPLPVVSREDLIDAKRIAGRPQDIADLKRLGADR